MPYLYRGLMTFDTPTHDSVQDGWTNDCQGKRDYDPMIVTLNSRVYPDGNYLCSVYLGEHQIAKTGVMTAPTPLQARVAVEQWCEEQAQKIADAVCAAYGVEKPQ